jgi:hypothetical protein
MVRIARVSESAMLAMARASSTPALNAPRQIGRLSPTIAITPMPSAIV